MDKRQQEIIIGQAYNLAVSSTKNYTFSLKQHKLRLKYFKMYLSELKYAQEIGLKRIPEGINELVKDYEKEFGSDA